MQIKNTISKAVFNFEAQEAKEVLEKNPFMEITKISAEEKKELEKKPATRIEDKILGKQGE